MTGTVEIPLWFLVLVLGFAAVTFASHFLFPSVRWFFRRRMERAVARLNTRLQRPVEPFKLLERHDRILRLIYDPQVMAAVVAHARETGVPESVAFEKARHYAREIVPGFSATLYFGFAVRAARWLSRSLYRVEVGALDDPALRGMDPDATVVFVMNHRSNMDYVLVTWLVSERMTLSYAVGEWARVWPLTALIRGMGAYYIRRRHLTPLYRRVLERYVQMSTAEGVAQAIFPEGGLSLDGRVGPPKAGLLGYIMSEAATGAATGPGREVIFVPVGLCYDRVMEDRVLTEARQTGVRRFRASPLAIAAFVARMGLRKLRGRFDGFGAAGVNFGAPLSLREHLGTAPDLAPAALAARLMTAVRRAVPVLPVPLVASILVRGPIAPTDLPAAAEALIAQLSLQGATMNLPPDDPPTAFVDAALRPLRARGIVTERDGMLQAAPDGAALLEFHAAPVLQLLEEAADPARDLAVSETE